MKCCCLAGMLMIGLAASQTAAGAAKVDRWAEIDTLCPPREVTKPVFKSGTYKPAACGYREAALAIYRYMVKLPGMRKLVETGKVDQRYQHNAYVSKTHAAHIMFLLNWMRYDPVNRETALKYARASAQFLLTQLEPDDAPLAWWPPTYGRKPLEFDPATDGPYEKPYMRGNEPIGAVQYRGEVMLLYPAQVANAFLAFAKETGDKIYLEAAKNIAETYLRVRRPDGSWPLKMKLATGETVGENTLVPCYLLQLFSELKAQTGDAKWGKIEDEIFAWIEANPLTDWNWDGQYEDIAPAKPYQNPTKDNALQTMIYMLKRFPGDAGRLAVCRRLMEFSEKRFVVWEHPHWPTPCVLEQYSCFTPIDASAAQMIFGYLALYEAEHNPVDLEKARAIANTITRVQLPSGRVPTFWAELHNGGTGISDERYDWLNCMAWSAKALLEVDDVCRRESASRGDWRRLTAEDSKTPLPRRYSIPLRWNSIGTSISCFDGYQSRTMEQLRFTGFVNSAISGSTIVDAPGSVASADLYTVEHGINDWGRRVPPGTIDDYRNCATNGTFAARYRTLIDKIRSVNPRARIVLCTPRKGYGFNGYLPDHCDKQQPGGYLLKDYVDIVYAIAELEWLPVADFYRTCGEQDELAELSCDVALHPNAAGCRRLANILAKTLLLACPEAVSEPEGGK